jgi:hypothetical protein
MMGLYGRRRWLQRDLRGDFEISLQIYRAQCIHALPYMLTVVSLE